MNFELVCLLLSVTGPSLALGPSLVSLNPTRCGPVLIAVWRSGTSHLRFLVKSKISVSCSVSFGLDPVLTMVMIRRSSSVALVFISPKCDFLTISATCESEWRILMSF